MAAEWPMVRLEEFGATDRKAFAMGPFGSNIRSENYKPTGIPVLRGVNLGADGSLDGELVYLSEAKAEELKNSQAFPGDLFRRARNRRQSRTSPQQTTVSEDGAFPKPDEILV
jgi:hypothetical protein